MSQNTCPLCGEYECRVEDTANNEYAITCESYNFRFLIEQDTFSMWNDQAVTFSKIINSIIFFLKEHPYYGRNTFWRFYYDEAETSNNEKNNINVHNLFAEYPQNATERLDKMLLNISKKYPNLGTTILLDCLDYPFFYIDTLHAASTSDFSYANAEAELYGCYKILSEMGYVSIVHEQQYLITGEGWKKIGELQKKADEINQGFIAMKYGSETDSISKAFEEAIDKHCHYFPFRMDKLHYNGQIVPEMLYQIERSKFLVVDVTYPNYGAYFEAGYGMALGKEVILCCERSKLDSSNRIEAPHFDIIQHGMVVWDDKEDLVQRLSERIEATVGKNML